MPGKRYYLYFLLLLLSIPSYSNAQWELLFEDGTLDLVYSNDTIVYTGGFIGGLRKSTNNGLNWTSILGGNGFRKVLLYHNDMYVCKNSSISKSTNNGSTWNNIFVGSTPFDLSIKDSIFLTCTSTTGIHISTNYGSNWIQTNVQNQFIRRIVRKGNKVFAGGDQGVYVSTDDGMNWSQSLDSNYVLSLEVHGNNLYSGVYDFGVFMSSDDGETWNQTPFDTGVVNGIYSLGNSLFIKRGNIYRSEDNFQTWISIPNPPSVIAFNSISFNSEYLFAVGYWNAYRIPLPQVTGIHVVSNETPDKHTLHQNYPNPFNPSTKISFAVSKKGHVKMFIFDHLGREVATFINEELSPGTYEKEFDGSALSSGIYYYKIITGEFTETKKMVLVK